MADAVNDLFAAKFLQIIGGVAGAVLAWALFTECAHANGDIGRPIARDKVSAILARPAASEIVVKQFPSLVKVMPASRAGQATYSWPFKITWAGKGGCPLILIVRWPQSGSRM